MRPNISGSLRRIALGVMLPAVLTSTGCYHSMGYPGYGYGSPMYGNQYPGYGGNQGIQTLTPGNYYAPGTTPTYSPNSLSPTPDPNASGSGGGAGGGNAPPYSPPTGGDPPSRLVPNDPLYPDNGASGDSNAPQDDPSAQPQLNQFESGNPSTLSKPAPNEEWAESKLEHVSGSEGAAAEAEPIQTSESTDTAPALEAAEPLGEPEEEPPLLAPPVAE